DHCDRKVGTVSEEVVHPLLGTPVRATAGDDDPSVGERALLLNLLVGPTCPVKLGDDVLPARVRFGRHGQKVSNADIEVENALGGVRVAAALTPYGKVNADVQFRSSA
ncbi:MAG: hypothetical protein IT452_09090, partial [Planctomycetia bacterium]|nr:hypothetical protein [Planctomycetia bacterium]